MFLTPGRISGAYRSFRRDSSRDTAGRVFEHLKLKQNQLWTSASSVLTFDGLMIAGLLVLASNQLQGIDVTIEIKPLFLIAFVSYFISAILAVTVLNMHGDFSKVETPAEEEAVFFRMILIGSQLNLLSLLFLSIATGIFLFEIFI